VRELKAGDVLMGDAPALGKQLEEFVRRTRTAPAAARDGEEATRYSMDHIVDALERTLREVTDGNPA
jgi:hypothetical protein